MIECNVKASLFTLLVCIALLPKASTQENNVELVVPSTVPQLYCLKSNDQGEIDQFFCSPCSRSSVFTNAGNEKRKLGKWGKATKITEFAVFKGSVNRLRMIPINAGTEYSTSTGIPLYGMIGFEDLFPNSLSIKNKSLENLRGSVLENNRVNTRAWVIEIDGRMGQLKSELANNGDVGRWFLDDYNDVSIGLQQEAFEEMVKSGKLGKDVSTKTNPRERRFATSIEVHGVIFKNICVTKLETPFSVIGIEAIRQHCPNFYFSRSNDGRYSTKIVFSENVDEAYVLDRLFCNLIDVVVHEEGCMIYDIHPFHPLAKHLVSGDALLSILDLDPSFHTSPDILFLLHRTVVHGGTIKVKRGSSDVLEFKLTADPSWSDATMQSFGVEKN